MIHRIEKICSTFGKIVLAWRDILPVFQILGILVPFFFADFAFSG